MRHNRTKFPPDYVRRVNDFLEYQWTSGATIDAGAIMKDLPPPLQLELRMCLNRKIIDTQPLFWELGPELMMVLITALKSTITTPNETLIREGDASDLLFFLVHGECVAYVEGSPDNAIRARRKRKARASAEAREIAEARQARARHLDLTGGVFAGKGLNREAASLSHALRGGGDASRRESETSWTHPRRASVPPSDDVDRPPRRSSTFRGLVSVLESFRGFQLQARAFSDASLRRVGISRDDGDDDGDSGSAEYVVLLSVLKIGAVIGEIGLLATDNLRTASVLTTSHCELYSLDADTFDHIRSRAAEWDAVLHQSSAQRRIWSTKMMGLVRGDSEHAAESFVAKRRTTASRLVGPTRAVATTTIPKRDGQSDWDHLKQQKITPALESAKTSLELVRNSSSKTLESMVRAKRISASRFGLASGDADAGGDPKAGEDLAAAVSAALETGNTEDRYRVAHADAAGEAVSERQIPRRSP